MKSFEVLKSFNFHLIRKSTRGNQATRNDDAKSGKILPNDNKLNSRLIIETDRQSYEEQRQRDSGAILLLEAGDYKRQRR